jgi:hypothetical protein
MATDASIVMTYLPGDAHREASYRHVVDWYFLGLGPVYVEAGVGGRAAAINRAVAATDGDVIVQVDSDSLVPHDAIRLAIDMASTADGLVVPHSRYLYLTEAVTAEVLAGRGDPMACGPDDCDSHGPNGVGNAVVFSRATWRQAGGYDERMRFGDDAAFAYACEAFTGQPTRRVGGDVVHLWHPRPAMSIPGTPEYLDEFVRVGEYRDAAAAGPDAVRRLVESR